MNSIIAPSKSRDRHISLQHTMSVDTDGWLLYMESQPGSLRTQLGTTLATVLIIYRC